MANRPNINVHNVHFNLLPNRSASIVIRNMNRQLTDIFSDRTNWRSKRSFSTIILNRILIPSSVSGDRRGGCLTEALRLATICHGRG